MTPSPNGVGRDDLLPIKVLVFGSWAMRFGHIMIHAFGLRDASLPTIIRCRWAPLFALPRSVVDWRPRKRRS